MSDLDIEIKIPKGNMEVYFGDKYLIFELMAKKTILNRIKFSVLCFFMPFKIKRWD